MHVELFGKMCLDEVRVVLGRVEAEDDGLATVGVEFFFELFVDIFSFSFTSSNSPRVDTVLDVDALFFQHVEDRFRVGVESALEIVDGLGGTFQLMTFHVFQAFEMAIARTALVFLGVGRKVGDVAEMMVKLVGVQRVVQMTSGFIDGQSDTVVA